MSAYYLGVLASRKHELPPSLLPQLKAGECAGCHVGLLFHGATVDRFIAACNCLGREPRIVCPHCAAHETEEADTLITATMYDADVAKHFNKG